MKLKCCSFSRVCLYVISSVVPLEAASLHWDGTSTGVDADGGVGTWSTAASPANWDTAASGGVDTAWSADSEAVFGGTGGVVTVSGTVSASSLVFTAQGYFLTGGNVSLTGAPVIATGANDVTLDTILAGAAPITKTGAGTLTMGVSNSFTGGFTIAAGQLVVGNAAAPDTNGLLGTGPVTIAGGASFTLARGGSTTVTEIAHAFSGSGGLTIAGNNNGSNGYSDFKLTGDSSTFTGPITVSNARISAVTGKETGSGAINLTGRSSLFAEGATVANPLVFSPTGQWKGFLQAGGNLILADATITGPVTLSGPVATRVNAPGYGKRLNLISGAIGQSGGTGSIAFFNEGTSDTTYTLSGASTYTGTTTVNSGAVLNLTGSLAGTAVTVSGSIGGSGVIGTGGSLTMAALGKIKVPTSGEALTVNGNVTLQTSSYVAVDMKPGVVAGDPIPVLHYTGTLTGAAQLGVDASFNYRKAVLAFTPNLITVDIGSKALIWKGAGSDYWQDGAVKWATTNEGAAADVFYRGDSVEFNDSGSGGLVRVGNTVFPSGVLVNNSSKEYNIGGFIAGPCALVKKGSGKLILSGMGSSYTGGTTIEAGVVELRSGTTPLGSGPVSVGPAAVLYGGGTIQGPLTLAGTLGDASGTAGVGIEAGPTVLSGSYRCWLTADSSDWLAVTGDLDLTGSELTLATHDALFHEDTFVIARYTGNLTGFFAAVSGVPAGYVLKHLPASKQIVVVRKNLDEWLAGYPGLGDVTADGDPDHDGMVNLMEYVLGGNPGGNDTGILPTQGFDFGNAFFRFKRSRISAAHTLQVVQWSTDLKNWTDVPTSGPGVHTYSYSYDLEEITVSVPPSPGGMFFRLKVTEL
ncbi:autotransporter-associated beta strand repeat-containing protein [Luteolibacter soli]|uniref:Autotransporter-associated beta strand repeat-containing protein n=1 Tax=Luteolibacter soli TaxID=3135280 RepID=A0ABU9AVK5_9BACT